jgi:hypothetical protein
MYSFNNTRQDTALDERISELLDNLNNTSGSEEAYTTTTDNLVKLYKIKHEAIKLHQDNRIEEEKVANDKEKIAVERDKLHHESEKLQLDGEKFDLEQEKTRTWKPSPDAIVGAAASVVGIVLVLHYEKLGVVTSKALGFLGKLK